MKIKLVDLKRLNHKLRISINNSIRQVVDSGEFVLGRQLLAFEKEFSSYIGTKYCVGVASGTDAMLLSLLALGVTKDDEVIVPAMTFIADIVPILTLSAKPVLVDILSTAPCIDPRKIEEKITKKTKVIVPVHLHGYPCEMGEIQKIARRHKLFIIEDACQAHGSTFKKRRMGSFGDISIFSFYPGKNLGAFGDGGAVTTNNRRFYDKLLLLRNYGQIKKYKHVSIGFNSRLDEIQAAVLRKKLKYLDDWNEKRRLLANTYTTLLKELPFILPSEGKGIKTNFHLFAIKTKLRDSLFAYLRGNGIECGIHYPTPIHLIKPFRELEGIKGSFPNAELHAKTSLSLPMFPQLSKGEVFRICKLTHTFFSRMNK